MTDCREEITSLLDSIDSELQPFIDGIRMIPKKDLVTFKEAYKKFRVRYEDSWAVFEFITKDMGKTAKKATVKEQIFELFSYLGFVESLGNCFVDILVMLLVANGRDFHIESRHATPRIRHVVAMDDLEKERIPLTTKLNFLKDSGILNFTSIVDSRLRNDIAHLKFTVVKDEIRIRGKPAKEIIDPCLKKLVMSITEVSEKLYDLAEDMGWEERIDSPVKEKTH